MARAYSAGGGAYSTMGAPAATGVVATTAGELESEAGLDCACRVARVAAKKQKQRKDGDSICHSWLLGTLWFSVGRKLRPQGTRGCTGEPRDLIGVPLDAGRWHDTNGSDPMENDYCRNGAGGAAPCYFFRSAVQLRTRVNGAGVSSVVTVFGNSDSVSAESLDRRVPFGCAQGTAPGSVWGLNQDTNRVTPLRKKALQVRDWAEFATIE